VLSIVIQAQQDDLVYRRAARDSITHQFAQAVRQAMRRQLQVMLDHLEPSDAEEHVADPFLGFRLQRKPQFS
jgi:hypothetical protein